jgi:uncharacterized membrane protein
LAGVLISLSFFDITYALAENIDPSQEAIRNFHANIRVNTDNSIDVVESITYNTGEIERHGLLRDIYPYSSVDYSMKIENVSVADENDNPYTFSISNQGKYLEIKIGDPDKTFAGRKTYVIKYHATKAIAQFEDFDEIYWNVTGNDWRIPIYETSASVVFPSGVVATQTSCYFGPEGSTKECHQEEKVNNSYDFIAPESLNAYEGLTIAAGFPKGIVSTYTEAEKNEGKPNKYFAWLVVIMLPLFTLFFSLRHWHKKGRDPKGRGVIVPQYDVPDGLTPMEVGGIVNENVNVKNISAEIIYLATKGYLKINQLEEKFIGLIKTTDYELMKLKDFSDVENNFDKKLLTSLFNPRPQLSFSSLKDFFLKGAQPLVDTAPAGQSIKLSDLKNVFHKDAASVVTSVLDTLLNKGYYKNLGRMKNSGGRIILIIFFSVWASMFFGGIFGVFLFMGNPLPLMFSIFISIIIYGIVSHFSPAKTEKGVATKEYLLGLKDYLQIAEKDRIIFHNAPEKRPEIFEKLLPYAMVLGVANIWAKEFEGIYTTPPSWYSRQGDGAFNAVVFSNSLSSFSSYASSSMSSSPSGSGSGGGGSSGGGGGGGGGGGW